MASTGVTKRRKTNSFTSDTENSTETDNQILHKKTLLQYLHGVDEELSEQLSFCASKESGAWRYVLVLLEVSGHGVPWIAASILGILIFAGTQQQFACNILLALLLDLAVVGSMKVVFRRSRPSYNEKDMFATVSVDNYSFPSGHSTRAAMVAGIIGAFHTNQMHRVLLYVWAACVASSRVVLGRHHISDVICGVIIGLVQFGIMMLVWLPEELCKTLLDYLPFL